FGELTAEDFAQHPVWISVHGLDEEEPWYDEDGCNEETFRPWTGALPVSPEEGLLLVAAIFTVAMALAWQDSSRLNVMANHSTLASFSHMSFLKTRSMTFGTECFSARKNI